MSYPHDRALTTTREPSEGYLSSTIIIIDTRQNQEQSRELHFSMHGPLDREYRAGMTTRGRGTRENRTPRSLNCAEVGKHYYVTCTYVWYANAYVCCCNTPSCAHLRARAPSLDMFRALITNERYASNARPGPRPAVDRITKLYKCVRYAMITVPTAAATPDRLRSLL